MAEGRVTAFVCGFAALPADSQISGFIVLKNLLIDFALWMAQCRTRQAEDCHESSAWWADLSMSLEEDVPLRVVRSRREARQ